jgi:hypothetical protein
MPEAGVSCSKGENSDFRITTLIETVGISRCERITHRIAQIQRVTHTRDIHPPICSGTYECAPPKAGTISRRCSERDPLGGVQRTRYGTIDSCIGLGVDHDVCVLEPNVGCHESYHRTFSMRCRLR